MVRRGVLVFVSTLAVVVVAVGLFAMSVAVPAATSSTSILTSSSDDLLRGSGPVSTFPKSWDDPCGSLVSGNGTTGGTNYAGNPLVPNLNLTQVYSTIVSSSAFQKLAAGRSWVTLDWSIAQMGPAPPPTVVVGQFLFVSGGVPVPYGFVQMEYYVASGAVAGGFIQDQSTCVQGSPGFSYGIRLSPGTYAPGQPVGINFTFTNLTNTTMTITGRNSCLGNFTVLQGFYGPVVYDSAEHPLCTGPPLKVVLSAGKTTSQTVEWNQTDNAGAQVPPGDYFVFGTETGYLGQIFPVPVIEGLTIDKQTAG